MVVLDPKAQTDIALPELVRDLMLPVTTDRDLTIHPQPFPRRNKPREHIWACSRNLGRGGYGEVWLEQKVEGDDDLPQLRAVKSIRMLKEETIFELNGGRCVRELEALAKFSQDTYQQFFVKSYGWYTTPGSLNIAMEYCEDGDLQAYLDIVKTIPTQQVHDIALQVLGALASMHGTRFAHRDLKPANILIKAKPPKDWWVKLCDFGLSKRHEGMGEASTVRGTPSFMAPETLGFPFTGDPKKASPYSADMWCFGETLFRCHTGHAAFEDKEQLYEYQQGKRLFPAVGLQRAKASGLALNFIRQLMLPVPSERLNITRAKDHPWMRDKEKKKLEKLPIKLTQDIQKSRKQRSDPEREGSRRRSQGPLQGKDNQITEASGQWSATDTQSFPPQRRHFEPVPQQDVLKPYSAYTVSPIPSGSQHLGAASPPLPPTQQTPSTRRDHRSRDNSLTRRLESRSRLVPRDQPDPVEERGTIRLSEYPLTPKTGSKPSKGLPKEKKKEVSPGKEKTARPRKTELVNIKVVEEQENESIHHISQLPMGRRVRPLPPPSRPSSMVQKKTATENKNNRRWIETPDNDTTHSSIICNASSSVKEEGTREGIRKKEWRLDFYASSEEDKTETRPSRGDSGVPMTKEFFGLREEEPESPPPFPRYPVLDPWDNYPREDEYATD